MDKSVLCGFVFCHGAEDFSLWETDAISNEDMHTILTILEKYQDKGSSVRNCYEEVVGSLVAPDYPVYPRKEI